MINIKLQVIFKKNILGTNINFKIQLIIYIYVKI